MALAWALAVHPGVAGADDAVPADGRALDLPRRGLTFQIANNLTLTSFQGFALSYRARGSGGGGWRGGLSLSGFFNDAEETSRTPDTTFTSEFKARSGSAGIILQKVIGPAADARLGGYWAIGPEVFYAWSTTDQDPRHDSARSWGAGLSTAVGAEWRFQTGVSIHAEYGPSVSYRWNRMKITTGAFSSDRTVRGLQFSGDAVRFGLTAWFR